MWVTDIVIEAEKKRRQVILPKPEKRSKPEYLDIEGFLEREKMRRTKERK